MGAKNEWGLTGPQERFAQEVASGKTGVAAYKIAYPRSQKWASESVRVNSSQMLADTNVSQRVKALRAAAAEAAGRAELGLGPVPPGAA